MDVVSTWFVVLLVVLSGAVAALGDFLGRKLGKKRLRWGRLRPKHTAIMMTAIAGMLTTLLTIVVLSLLSEPVRIWLIEGQQVRQELNRTTDQLDQAELNLERLTDDVTQIREELQKERENLSVEQQKVADATRQADELRRDAEQLRIQVAAFSEQLEDSKERLIALQSEFDDLDDQRIRLEGTIDTYSDQQQELIDENNRLIALNDQFENEILDMETEIARLKKEVENTQEAQRIASENFETARQRIAEDRQTALKELSDAEVDLAKARSDLQELRRIGESLLTDTVRARTKPLIFSGEDELARLPVRTLMSQSEARTSLRRVIEMASRVADAIGAAEAPNSRNAVSLRSFLDADNNQITIEMQSEAAIRQLEGNPEEQLIRIVSQWNSFEGEWVWIGIKIDKNPIVYREGDLIVEGRIDGRAGVQGVYEQLAGLISKQVTERAISDGMIPAVGRPQVLGEISREEMQRIVTTIVDAGRNVRIRFHSAAELRAGDSLQLDIRLG